ncbi:MAG TPA: carboxypeptidase-like regulatory domain-containing protein [Cyclobacteriaceae bacterium]|nr:carboxypeptidase-like regulatory domain-containing protein [Cyclobacteriaceae bacterium]
MVKVKLIFALLSLFSLNGFAQSLVISGKVLDAENNEPLVFASVRIKGKSLGTISNLNGEFDFYLPADFRNEIITISYLGHENFETPVWAMVDKPGYIIRLKASPLVLDEILVSDQIRGGELLRIALERIEHNYPTNPFMLDGFYRDLKQVGGTYFALLEAAVKIYDDGYKNPRNKYKLRENVSLIEVRKSVGYNNKFTAYFEQHNLLEDLLLHNNVRYRQFDNSDIFFNGLGRLPNTIYNNKEVFVVYQYEPYLLKIFIDKNSYAIIRLEYEIKASNEIISKRKNMYSSFSGLKKVIDFKEFEGKMYLEYMELTSTVNWYDIKTDELKFETGLFQQLLINNIEPSPEYRINSTEKMKRYGLQYQDRDYNEAFWENYNVIKDSPLDKKIIDDLNRQVLSGN